MIIDKISLQVLYSTGNFSNIRPLMEATLEPNDTPEQCLTQLKQRLDNWFWETHPELSSQRGTQERVVEEVQVVKIPDELTATLDGINACTEMEGDDGLKSYWLRSKGNLMLSTAYKQKEKQLTDAK
jgi:hypothetical protein